MVITYKTPRKDLYPSPQDQLPAKKERKNPNWPKLLPRMQWAIQLGLCPAERNERRDVLHHVGAGLAVFPHLPRFRRREANRATIIWRHLVGCHAAISTKVSRHGEQ